VRWNFRKADQNRVTELQQALKLSRVVALLLVNRRIVTPEDAENFLHPALTGLYSPYAMLGMRAAVDRIRAAIERKETILIYGDYDVDGTTAIVILKTAIEICGGVVQFHVPHRIKDGYGMKDDVIERAAGAGVRLIISVDTGIRAFAAAEAAKRVGVDLIVTDHHLPETDQGVPQALAVLNPNQSGCEYPCKALCGAGVAFKVAQALLEETGRSRLLPSFIKIVAIATVADAVPLIGENRIFTKLGLEGLRQPVNAGLRAILEISSLDGARPITTGDIAFRVAPRLNAAGRMDVAQTVIELFSEKDPKRAREIAERLTFLNGERQQEEAQILKEIEDRVAAAPELREAYCLVIDGESWHRGVIGIAATRVVERYCRPALVLSRDGEEAHGSGRSIHNFHLLEALESCRELFSRFGGHAHAVGLALPCEHIEALRSRLDAYARERLTEADFVPLLKVEAEVEWDEIGPKLFHGISQLEPFGMGNPQPVLVTRNAQILLPPKTIKDRHVKFRLSNAKNGNASRKWDALAWRMAERCLQESLLVGDSIDIAFTLEHNDHPEFGGLELRLEDFARSPVAVRAESAGSISS
jgi:single-stranded-DNA-specific exonuclease